MDLAHLAVDITPTSGIFMVSLRRLRTRFRLRRERVHSRIDANGETRRYAVRVNTDGRQGIMKNKTLLTASAALAMAGSAMAITELQIDINALRASARFADNSMGFGGIGHTGNVFLSSTGTTNLAGVLIDGSPQPIVAGQLMTLSGVINLVNGMVMGGNIDITLNNGDTFTTDIQSGFGQVQFQAGQGFSIDGLTENGFFSSNSFAGVNVSTWYNDQPLEGSFIEFAFGPNGMGIDNDTNLDIFLPAEEDRPEIPAPLAGTLAGLGLLGLGARRRR